VSRGRAARALGCAASEVGGVKGSPVRIRRGPATVTGKDRRSALLEEGAATGSPPASREGADGTRPGSQETGGARTTTSSGTSSTPSGALPRRAATTGPSGSTTTSRRRASAESSSSAATTCSSSTARVAASGRITAAATCPSASRDHSRCGVAGPSRSASCSSRRAARRRPSRAPGSPVAVRAWCREPTVARRSPPPRRVRCRYSRTARAPRRRDRRPSVSTPRATGAAAPSTVPPHGCGSAAFARDSSSELDGVRGRYTAWRATSRACQTCGYVSPAATGTAATARTRARTDFGGRTVAAPAAGGSSPSGTAPTGPTSCRAASTPGATCSTRWPRTRTGTARG